MGTLAEISLYGAPRDRAEGWVDLGFQELTEVEKSLSFYDSDSQLSQINRSAGHGFFSPDRELRETLTVVEKAHHMTRGGFDPTVGPLVRIWKKAIQEGRLPSVDELDLAREFCGWESVHKQEDGMDFIGLPHGFVLDLGGIAKGYGVDRAAEKLISVGVSAGIVNVGGDLRSWGCPPGRDAFAIGVRHPRRQGEGLAGTLTIQSASVVTSGDYEQGFVHEGTRYSHVVNPRSGWPAQGLLSVTVMAASAALADALATGIMALGPQDGLAVASKMSQIEVLLFIEDQGRLTGYATPGFLASWSPKPGCPEILLLPVGDSCDNHE